jgi:argininosuccinate synthase
MKNTTKCTLTDVLIIYLHLLRKICMKLSDLKGLSVAFAGSGGLDSCTITRWLTDEDVKVICFTADLGQPDEPDMEVVRHRMESCGALEFKLLPLQQELADVGIRVIQAQANYEGRYWNTTGAARYVLVKAVVIEMKKLGLHIFSHGATGRGNCQVRFQVMTKMLAPNFKIYAPWRDEVFINRFGGRHEMLQFCQERRLPINTAKEGSYSSDANLLGIAHAPNVIESITTHAHCVKPIMGCYPLDAPNDSEDFEVCFESGYPVEINSSLVNSLEAILRANTIAGRHGIGIGIHLVENRIVGIKSRETYESPGMELLGTCYRMLLQLILDRSAYELFEHLSKVISKQIYQGYWLDLTTQMAFRGIKRTAELVTGRIRVSLYKGNIKFISVYDAPHSLYSPDNSSLEAVGSYNHADSEGMLRILEIGACELAINGQIEEFSTL